MGTALRSSHNVLLCRGPRQLLEGAKYVHGQNKLRHFREIYIYIYTVYGIYNIHTHTGKACDTEDTSWLGRGLRKTTGMAGHWRENGWKPSGDVDGRGMKPKLKQTQRGCGEVEWRSRGSPGGHKVKSRNALA